MSRRACHPALRKASTSAQPTFLPSFFPLPQPGEQHQRQNIGGTQPAIQTKLLYVGILKELCGNHPRTHLPNPTPPRQPTHQPRRPSNRQPSSQRQQSSLMNRISQRNLRPHRSTPKPSQTSSSLNSLLFNRHPLLLFFNLPIRFFPLQTVILLESGSLFRTKTG